MQSSRGNFLLQALLALTLLFAFVPFIAIKLLGRESDALMYATTRQIDNATTAARIYIRENVNGLPYERTVISGNAFSDTLEPYGLPLGFVPKTALGQDISLVIDKTPDAVSAYLDLSGGKLSELKRAELVRRVGFYAADAGDGDAVRVGNDKRFSREGDEGRGIGIAGDAGVIPIEKIPGLPIGFQLASADDPFPID